MEDNKEYLKKSIKHQFLHMEHKDNKNAVGLKRLINVENGYLMARYGWQYNNETVEAIFNEIANEVLGQKE